MLLAGNQNQRKSNSWGSFRLISWPGTKNEENNAPGPIPGRKPKMTKIEFLGLILVFFWPGNKNDESRAPGAHSGAFLGREAKMMKIKFLGPTLAHFLAGTNFFPKAVNL